MDPATMKPADDPVTGNNGLVHIHTDHLGSAAFLTTAGQSEQIGTRARCLPFGAFRATATISDRSLTGHKHINLGRAGPVS